MEFTTEPNRIYHQGDDGQLLAEISLPAADERTIAITHTFVDESLRGQGVAGQLMEAATKQARVDGMRVKPVCSYAVAWFEKHPEECDLLCEEAVDCGENSASDLDATSDQAADGAQTSDKERY